MRREPSCLEHAVGDSVEGTDYSTELRCKMLRNAVFHTSAIKKRQCRYIQDVQEERSSKTHEGLEGLDRSCDEMCTTSGVDRTTDGSQPTLASRSDRPEDRKTYCDATTTSQPLDLSALASGPVEVQEIFPERKSRLMTHKYISLKDKPGQREPSD